MFFTAVLYCDEILVKCYLEDIYGISSSIFFSF